MMPRSIFRLCLLAIIVLNLLVSSSDLSAEEARNIYLVRHAEKQLDGTRDPSLTEEGSLRATNISKQLQNENISSIYSTNYKRTKQTALPLSKRLKIDLTLYNPNQLKDFAKQVLLGKDNILIVGHSDTTPQLVELLGGDSHGSMAETVYDRIYLIVIKGSKIQTFLLSSNTD